MEFTSSSFPFYKADEKAFYKKVIEILVLITNEKFLSSYVKMTIVML